MSEATSRKGHRWFAAIYDLTAKGDEKKLRPLRELAAGGATGRVIEVGCGTGLNLGYYDWQAVEALDATEPDPFMLRRAEAKAATLADAVRARLRFHPAPAEALPFPDASFDSAVATLVLCSVRDPALALAELRRVLRPGGRLRLVEHARAPGFAGRVQRPSSRLTAGSRPAVSSGATRRRACAPPASISKSASAPRWGRFGPPSPASPRRPPEAARRAGRRRVYPLAPPP